MTDSQKSPVSNDCGVRVTQVRISNFRSMENIEVDLGDLTLLVGANNSGKTSFLEALHAAIGSGRRTLTKEDIHLKKDETQLPRSRTAVIDILVRPCNDENEKLLDSFPAGSFWTQVWRGGITQNDDLNDFVAVRTLLAWNTPHGEYRVERKFLKKWPPFSDWLSVDTQEGVTSHHLEPVALYYMDAQRDIEEDLHNAGSFWRRLISDLGLPKDSVDAFEKILTDLNEQVVANSPVLNHIHDHLVKIDTGQSKEQANIGIAPVARDLRDLAKGIDIHFATNDAQSFPLAKHGMGTRSSASILVFHAYASWKKSQSEKNHEKVHTLLAIEEPEAHLHPQAQRSVFGQIKQIPGQRIISTHSPYFASQSRLEDLRLFQKKGSHSKVSQLDTTILSPDARRKLEQQIFQTSGLTRLN